ncbi:3122_t:CDS:1 [Paraglomus occultum]|uniref:3122_t:CDS:1 n=1 Tax=Paraglomus occultum TaxID=144539 RepID=A0A9N8ZWN2_9GLOM|nr:3122_t:CDS:1 [Paraglomus occultum]
MRIFVISKLQLVTLSHRFSTRQTSSFQTPVRSPNNGYATSLLADDESGNEPYFPVILKPFTFALNPPALVDPSSDFREYDEPRYVDADVPFFEDENDDVYEETKERVDDDVVVRLDEWFSSLCEFFRRRAS